MFEDVENKLRRKKSSIKKSSVAQQMKSSLPQIYNALHPSTHAQAMQTKIQMVSARQELQDWSQKNPESTQKQRAIFQDVLDRFGKISDRLKNLKAKKK